MLSTPVAFASSDDGTISGYAWSAEVGWIHFGSTNSSARITDTAVTGYAWNENTGWINLNPTNGGVLNNSSGTLSGKAWSEGMGWINFSDVSVNFETGTFSGTATGDSMSINFSCTQCNVSTDWRGPAARSIGTSSGSSSINRGGFDTEPPAIKITYIKNSYESNEEVLIAGTTEANAYITIIIDNRYGLFNADANGDWFITLGKMSVGRHHVTFTPKDSAGNVGETVAADFSVISNQAPFPEENVLTPWPSFLLGPPLAPILRDLAQGIQNIVPKFFRQFAKTPKPLAVITVPKLAPLAFSGKFHYISSEKLSLFALAPLPKEVRLLAEKFPEVENTFNKVGIQKITDLQKLANANLKLPTLHEALSANHEIPSEVVFATAGGGLVDFNVALSLNNQGKTEQTIKTIVGKPLQLVVRADKPVKGVTGYIVFKSRKYRQTSLNAPLNYLTASLLFPSPKFTTTLAPIKTDSNVEQRLVVGQFEYQNTGNGVYTATVSAPLVDGEYEIITMMEYQDANIAPKEIRLITVVDPEGYVYEKNGNQETRIVGAIVSLYWLDSNSKKYELWPAKDFQQEDPQTTDVRGTYSFLVPTGYYYIKVDAPGYLSYEGKPFEVKEGSGVHMNIELKTKYWLLKMFDWKTLLLILIILLLCYNFYKDKKRQKYEI